MKKLLTFALLFLLAPFAFAADAEGYLVVDYDLDGAAADNDIIVASVALSDALTMTLASQPDTPRPLVIGITDADSSISAGTITITGVDSAGTALSHVFTFASGGTTTSTTSTNFASVTSIVTSALTGEGAGDAVIVGTTSTIPGVYCALKGQAGVVLGAWIAGSKAATTSSSSTTVTSYVALSAAFAGVSVGDLLSFNLDGVITQRVVTAVASVNSITVDTAITLSTTGTGFYYRKQDCGTTATEGWIPMSPFKEGHYTVDVQQMNGTGGIVATLSCRMDNQFMNAADVWTKTFAAAGQETVIVEGAYHSCRMLLAWGTNDDGTDTTTAKEIIEVYFRGVTR